MTARAGSGARDQCCLGTRRRSVSPPPSALAPTWLTDTPLDAARREFRRARAAMRAFADRPDEFGAVARAYGELHAAWLRWEAAARSSDVDPFSEAPEWSPEPTATHTVVRCVDTFADLYGEGWRSVQHEAVPAERRGPLLASLDCGDDSSGGVFVTDSKRALYGLVVFSAALSGLLCQDVAIEVPIRRHGVVATAEASS
jgi:hypothetical protein